MEYLRWILLAIGVVLVLLVYVRGRAKRRSLSYSPLDAANDVPSFSASDDEDVWKDGVGPVRVVRSEPEPVDTEAVIADRGDKSASEPDENAGQAEPMQPRPEPEQSPSVPPHRARVDIPEAPVNQQPETASTEQPSQQQRDITTDDVIALYVVADRGQELKGEQILGAAMATELEHGEMNIFHRLDGDGNIVFSMANMMQPGWFDSERMHELKTRGVSLFIQLGRCENPVDALDDMLVCAHTLAGMLNAKMCDPDRQILNETVVKTLREKARYYHDLKQNRSEHENI